MSDNRIKWDNDLRTHTLAITSVHDAQAVFEHLLCRPL